MNATALRTSTTKTVTYFGRKALIWNVRKGTKATSERVQFILWVDNATEANGGHLAGTVSARHCIGDGTTKNFTLYAEEQFTDTADATAWATARLA